jgi:hypothetical protein
VRRGRELVQLTSSSSNLLSLEHHGSDRIAVDADVFVLAFGARIRVTRVNGVDAVDPSLVADRWRSRTSVGLTLRPDALSWNTVGSRL